ncbi:MAG: CDP-glycerol glycerophosphotransferase family protein [bacterium]|nr:CDP-glycerol glycerophosphotransferase family protein [bacterium]
MKTVFISSFHPLISRNILATGLLDLLLQRGDVRIVILVPTDKEDFFREEFGRAGVIVEGAPRALVKMDIFLRYLTLSEIGTKALKVIRKKEFDRIGSRLLRLVGKSSFGQRAVRALDKLLIPSGRFSLLLDKYQPDLVFSTDVQNENDVRLMHEAKSRNIRVAGMVRSWDNFTTKGLLRVFPDLLVVPNEVVKKEAVIMNYFPEERIVPVGIPHYDRYVKPIIGTREEFCRKIGLDPEKKLIFFAPIGNRYIRDNLLDKMALEALSAIDVNILVRMPPSDYVTLDGFKSKKAKVVFDEPGDGSRKDRKLNEVTREDDDHLIAELTHCDVVVTGQSTITIDAMMFDKPVVIIYFDQEERSYFESVKRYYDSEYYRPVAESGGVRFARSADELNALVLQYLSNPRLDEEGRARIAREQAYKFDGRSTERLASVLIQELEISI